MDNNEVEDIHSIGSSCNSDSTESEERLKRLFDNCDRDKDGFIDRFVLPINFWYSNNIVVLMFESMLQFFFSKVPFIDFPEFYKQNGLDFVGSLKRGGRGVLRHIEAD